MKFRKCIVGHMIMEKMEENLFLKQNRLHLMKSRTDNEVAGVTSTSSFTIASKIRDYMMLVKFSLSFMVVFSAVISYLLAPRMLEYDWLHIILLFIGVKLVLHALRDDAASAQARAKRARSDRKPYPG